MAASVETIGGLERRMTIKVPLAPLEGQIKQRLNQISRTAKFAGFRPGKALWQSSARRSVFASS
jgi:trigger factor